MKWHIGTSGWYYHYWKGPFYPTEISTNDMLRFYSSLLSTVEINYTFYRLPPSKTFSKWAHTVPKRFIFSCKASRYITHVKKLNDPQKTTKKLFSNMQPLKTHLGPILFQLPPNWKINKERFEYFLRALPSQYLYAFEFRNSSWFDDDIYDLLKTHRAAFCIHDFEKSLTPYVVTSHFVYIRLHGPEKEPYRGKYSQKFLRNLIRKCRQWNKDVYCYFNNDENGYAALNALEMQQMIS